jgi:hypothetical protein
MVHNSIFQRLIEHGLNSSFCFDRSKTIFMAASAEYQNAMGQRGKDGSL